MGVRTLFPILNSRDLPRLVAFYENALGATIAYRFASGDEDDYVSLRWGSEALGVGRVPDAATEGDRVALWFYVDDVDDAHRSWLAAGGSSLDAPADMPWGERVARVRDPDGNVAHLGTEATP